MRFSGLAVSLLFFSLAGCAEPSSSTSADEPESDEAAVTRAPAFKGSGAGKSVQLGGHAAKLIPVSTQVAALVKEMTEANDIQNNQFLAAVYTATPAELAPFFDSTKSYEAQKNMAFDMMYRADGSSPGGSTGFGWAEKWQPEYESMGCRPTTAEKADAQFKRFGAYKSHHGDDQISLTKRNLIKSDATKLVAAFLKGTTNAKLYRCHWDNNDDTTSEALISIAGSEVRVIVGWEGG